MENQQPQHIYGHSPSYSMGGMNEQGYHQMNPLTTVDEVSTGSVIDPNNSISSHQQPIFYDQAGMYAHSNVAQNSIQQQSYVQQGSFSHTTLAPPIHQQSPMTLQQPTTNQMYGQNPVGAAGTVEGGTISSMLSFQPIPQEQMFQTNTPTAKPMIAPPATVPVQPPNFHPNFQATTPPPLSHLQSMNIYQQPQQVPQVTQQPTNVVPPSMEMGNEESQPFKTPRSNKLPKARSPKKKVSPQTPSVSAQPTAATNPQLAAESSFDRAIESPTPMQDSPSTGPPPALQGGGATFPKLKDLVGRLLLCSLDAFPDKDFGEKTLMNLARKLSTGHTSKMEDPLSLQIWEKAIQQKDAKSGCVCIQRPREGRITVTKSGSGNSGSKKVFPQIVLCQMFRFPNVVFHHDIKSSEHCQNPAAVKPSELGKEGSEVDGTTADTICLNPYHYVISPEGKNLNKLKVRLFGFGDPLRPRSYCCFNFYFP